MTNNKNGVGYSRESKTEIKQQNNAQTIINLNGGDKYDKWTRPHVYDKS